MRVPTLAAAVIAFGVFPSVSLGGEFECDVLSKCRIDGMFPSVKWKPSGCYKPSQLHMPYGSSVREYNLAVDSFNSWQSEVTAYLNSEASG